TPFSPKFFLIPFTVFAVDSTIPLANKKRIYSGFAARLIPPRSFPEILRSSCLLLLLASRRRWAIPFYFLPAREPLSCSSRFRQCRSWRESQQHHGWKYAQL